MKIEEELRKLRPEKDSFLAAGVFDGVHLGHQYLINHLKERSRERGLLSGVVTFDPHPQKILTPGRELLQLTSLKERIHLLENLGVELIVVLPFTKEVAQLDAHTFIGLLKQHLRMKGLIIGPDFALGKDREGNSSVLKALSREMDFTIEEVPPVVLDGEVVSSTAIRQALAQGNIEKVRKLTGRNFILSGRVVHGVGRGRTLGFPTANLEVDHQQALPARGVYITQAILGEKLLPSVTNIGTRPTFGKGELTVEVYLLDFQSELYEQELSINIIEKIRDEVRFATTQELKEQILKDIKQARAFWQK